MEFKSWVEMNVLGIANQYHHKSVFVVDRTSKFKSHLLDSKPTTYGLKHRKCSNTSGITR